MDGFTPSHNLQSDQFHSDRGVLHFYNPMGTQTYLPMEDGVFLEYPHHSDPCTPIENWTSLKDSPGASPTMIRCQNPWGIETTQGYTPSPSTSPRETLFPFRQNESVDLSPTLMASCSSASQLEFGPRCLSRAPCALDSEAYYTTSQAVEPHQQQSEMQGILYPATSLAPPSPASMKSSYNSSHYRKMGSSAVNPMIDHNDIRSSPDETDEDETVDPPYSLLIYQALMSAPGMKLPLQGIYSWFEKNTAKGKDQTSKGWQNSIRHNLSMNAGFEAVREESATGKKAVNFWRLTDEAVKNGIQSTTRYRKQANYKRTLGSDPPALQRQRSGAKGGKATKVAAKFRGHMMSQEEARKERCRQRPALRRQSQKELYYQYLQIPTGTVLPFCVPSADAPMTRSSVEPFDLADVVGCADTPPCTSIFCDLAGPGADCFTLAAGLPGWCGIDSLPHGLLTGPEISADIPLKV